MLAELISANYGTACYFYQAALQDEGVPTENISTEKGENRQ